MGDGIDSNREWMAVDDECSCEGKGRSQLHVKTAVPPTDRLSRCSRPAFPRPCPTDHLRTSDPFPTPSVPPAASPLSSPPSQHNTTHAVPRRRPSPSPSPSRSSPSRQRRRSPRSSAAQIGISYIFTHTHAHAHRPFVYGISTPGRSAGRAISTDWLTVTR